MYRLYIVLLAILLLAWSQALAQEATIDSVAAAETLFDSSYHQFQIDSLEIERSMEVARLRSLKSNENAGIETIVEIIGVGIPIVFIIALAIVILKSRDDQKQVRLAMIHKGMDPSLLNTGNENSRKYAALRIGLLLAGLGLGLLIGAGIGHALHLQEDGMVLTTLSSAVLFGGAGLVIYHILASKMEKTS